jgi:predicted Zn-dependent protease
VTGKSQLDLISVEQEIAMGKQADQEVVATIGVYEDDDLQSYVERLGQEIAQSSERPDLPWTFRVLDDPTVNAFALPGGFIYVTRGILAHLNSEAELAAVLGHEIGHVTARHSVSRLSKAQLTNLGLIGLMIFQPELAQYGDLAQTGLGLLFLRFSRDDERQADDLGFRYMIEEGYDPREMRDVFQTLERASEVYGEGNGALPSWLATHPSPGERVERVSAELAETPRDLSSLEVAREPYLRRIDGMVFGEDPREGYFRESVFLHPELAFRLDFPSGWKAENQKQVVYGVSPGQDAAIQVTLAPGASAEEAARRFFSQSGLDVGRTWREPVNGLPAAWGSFGTRTQQGELVGVAGFVEHGGRVYQLIGFAPPRGWRRHEETVLRALGSFGRLTDPDALRVEPRRLRVVSTGGAASLQDFYRRYPSSVPEPVVALINQLATGAAIPPGQELKRVVGGETR